MEDHLSGPDARRKRSRLEVDPVTGRPVGPAAGDAGSDEDDDEAAVPPEFRERPSAPIRTRDRLERGTLNRLLADDSDVRGLGERAGASIPGETTSLQEDESSVGIEAFNLDAEMRSGQFDQTGFFVSRALGGRGSRTAGDSDDSDAASDSDEDVDRVTAEEASLMNFDKGAMVEAAEAKRRQAEGAEAAEAERLARDGTLAIPSTQLGMLEDLAQYLASDRPQDTPAAAMRRLAAPKGGPGAPGGARVRRPALAPEAQAQLDRLTALLTAMVDRHDMVDIYQMTQAEVAQQIAALREAEQARRARTAAAAVEPTDAGSDSDDMFSLAAGPGVASPAAATTAAPAAGPLPASTSTEAFWEYKWTEDEDPATPVYGPFSSTQMHAWAEAGLFSQTPSGAVFVRRAAPPPGAGEPEDFSDAPFRSSKRIDFSLYID
ncbi:hypothetical protein, variant [Fonticula alba]|nr:hypothetical protein, variant [Fonticula alba]KCV72824.1 hypothetical protein, variant [Fonticula alba]|eukprot:XP_009492525.1 hypothetical protein, variant [Fonticula alba]